MIAKEEGKRGQGVGKLLVFGRLSPESVVNVALLNFALPFHFLVLWLNSEVIMDSNSKTTWLFRAPKS